MHADHAYILNYPRNDSISKSGYAWIYACLRRLVPQSGRNHPGRRDSRLQRQFQFLRTTGAKKPLWQLQSGVTEPTGGMVPGPLTLQASAVGSVTASGCAS
jgi:hypothetical protein